MQPIAYYYALGFCLLCAGAYWLLRESGDPGRPVDSFGVPIEPPGKTRRQELLEARTKIQRQLEILQSPVGRQRVNMAPYVEYEMAELQALLDDVDKELADQRS